MLVVNDIEVLYDRVILVIKGVSLTVPRGGIVALLGANGAGKTTTAQACQMQSEIAKIREIPYSSSSIWLHENGVDGFLD
jgi:ABC-type branched-subunit amino acid transport system ATPase component